MDWTTLGSVLGSNFFIAFVSLATARWQISNAKQQLDKQLKSERERERRERRRVFRGEPLRNCKTELAVMASKFQRLVAAAQSLGNRITLTEEEALKRYDEVRLDMNAYLQSGRWFQGLFMLDDAELVDKMKKIWDEYERSLIVHLHYQLYASQPDRIKEAFEVYERATKRIIALQGLLNEKLEELEN